MTPLVATAAKAATPVAAAPAEGVIRQKSDYAFDETVARLRADISSKGIRFFDEIDHSALGAGANLPINRSKLLLFGNGGVVMAEQDLTEKKPVAPIDYTIDLTCPLLGLFGADDRSPPVEQVAIHEAELQRLGKDYEFHTRTSETWVRISMTHLMVRRLTSPRLS